MALGDHCRGSLENVRPNVRPLHGGGVEVRRRTEESRRYDRLMEHVVYTDLKQC